MTDAPAKTESELPLTKTIIESFLGVNGKPGPAEFKTLIDQAAMAIDLKRALEAANSQLEAAEQYIGRSNIAISKAANMKSELEAARQGKLNAERDLAFEKVFSASLQAQRNDATKALEAANARVADLESKFDALWSWKRAAAKGEG